MPQVELSRATVHYQVTGEGPPLLCVMGFGAPLEGFGPQVRALAAHRRVIAFDNRGVGRSSVPRLPWSIEDLAVDALELMDHLEIERADLLGISMGGMIAQRVAIARPARVNALVLAATFAHADRILQRRLARLIARAVAGWMRGGLGGRRAFERSMRDAWERHVVAGRPLDAEAQAILDQGWDLRETMKSSDLGVLGQLIALLGHDTRSALSLIRAPTLVIAGSADGLSPLHQARALASGIPGARLQILPGAPHGMNFVSPSAFNAAVEAFLNAHSPLRKAS